MKFICMKDHLAHAVSIAERFIGKNITLPILGNILMEAEKNTLRISATNLEYAVEIEIPGKGSEGRICIPAKIISSLIQSLKEDKVNLEDKQGNLSLTTEQRNVRVNGMPAEEFPLIPKVKKSITFSLEGFSLQNAIEKVLPAVSLSEFKPELAGILFKIINKNLYLAATDTFRLAEKVLDITLKGERKDTSFILPHRTAQELGRVLGREGSEVVVSIGENQAVFETESTIITSRLIEGNFPEYRTVIPTHHEISCFAKRDELIDAIRASSIFASKLQEVKFHFHGRMAEVVSLNPEVGEYKTTVGISPVEKDVSVSFNHRFFLDGMNALDEEESFLGIGDSQAPSVFRNRADNSFLYVLMPIQLS